MKVILVAAISLDGYITKHDAEGSGFTSPEDKKYYRSILGDFDCFIFGSKNFLLSKEWIQKRLRADQLKVIMSRQPERLASHATPGEIEVTDEPPAKLARRLSEQGRKKAALLGGGQIYGLFLKENAVDELWLTVEPLLFGGGTKLSETRLDFRGELISLDKLGSSTLLLKYRPREHRE